MTLGGNRGFMRIDCKMANIKLTGERQREYAVKCIKEAPDGYCVKIGEETRRDAQNRLLHAILGDMRKQVPAMQEYTIEQMKLRFMDAFGFEVTYLPKLEGAGLFPVGARTSLLSVKQFAGLIDLIYKYGAENGVLWTLHADEISY
jgi:NinB protein